MQDNLHKEFKPTSWSIDNKVSIYVVTVIIALAGILTYISLPKEQFPEVVFPQFYISTMYYGTAPEDMETLVTKPIEKQLGGISGVKEIKSTSLQDYSVITIEFNTDVNMETARQEVREKVDDAKPDLPTDLSQNGQEPRIIKIDVDKMPAIAQAYQISGVPTLILFRKGRPVWRQSGVASKKQLVDLIKHHV